MTDEVFGIQEIENQTIKIPEGFFNKMTGEEMTEEYVRNCKYVEADYFVNKIAKIKAIYPDGLTEGKPKWHRVNDGEYPPCEKGNYSINVLTDRGDIACYNYDDDCWVVEPSSAEIDPPVAWCEIPKYEEKK